MIKHEDNGQRFPCERCPNHRGRNGFRRKDHLTQHLRQYHHYKIAYKESPHWSCGVRCCPRSNCSSYRPYKSYPWGDSRNDKWLFKTQSEYNQHMKTVHDESNYPCQEPGCDKVGGKGYTREVDLVKHVKAKHDKVSQHYGQINEWAGRGMLLPTEYGPRASGSLCSWCFHSSCRFVDIVYFSILIHQKTRNTWEAPANISCLYIPAMSFPYFPFHEKHNGPDFPFSLARHQYQFYLLQHLQASTSVIRASSTMKSVMNHKVYPRVTASFQQILTSSEAWSNSTM